MMMMIDFFFGFPDFCVYIPDNNFGLFCIYVQYIHFNPTPPIPPLPSHPFPSPLLINHISLITIHSFRVFCVLCFV